MIKLFCKIFLLIIFFNLIVIKQVFPEPLKKIEIIGNERIPNETIEMFTSVSINDDIDNDKINNILKELYGSGFFSNVNVNFDNNVLKILVVENPIIENIFFDGKKKK